MIKNNEIIYTEVSEQFPDVYLDTEKKTFYFYASLGDLGRQRINFNTSAISTELEYFDRTEREVMARVNVTLDLEAGLEEVNKLEKLSNEWEVLWPQILAEFYSVRKGYSCDAPITSKNVSLSITPPGEADGAREPGLWACDLELEPWDGSWRVEFNVDGTVMNADVGF